MLGLRTESNFVHLQDLTILSFSSAIIAEFILQNLGKPSKSAQAFMPVKAFKAFEAISPFIFSFSFLRFLLIQILTKSCQDFY